MRVDRCKPPEHAVLSMRCVRRIDHTASHGSADALGALAHLRELGASERDVRAVGAERADALLEAEQAAAATAGASGGEKMHMWCRWHTKSLSKVESEFRLPTSPVPEATMPYRTLHW
eukprot:236011-Pleurochrysis_carterae.AAC.2